MSIAADPLEPEDFSQHFERSDEELDAVADEFPDALDQVIEVADMVTIMAAQRLQAIAAMCAEARAEVGTYGEAMGDVIDRSIRLELAAALRITEYAAGELMVLAHAAVDVFPAVHDSLARAGMTERHAEILVRELLGVEPDVQEKVLPQAIGLAETLPVGTFRRTLRSLLESVQSLTLAERHEAALETRRVSIERGHDGMGWLHLYGPEVEIRAGYDRLTAMANAIAKQEGEERTRDQLRADILGDLLVEGDTTSHPEEARGIRATVAVTVPVLSLLDDGVVGDEAELPIVEGVGPIPLQRARELCAGADGWMRILTHPETGMVLSVSREQYKPPPGLRRLVRWRAGRCMAPGCSMPTSRCEIDHNIAWEHGGHTCLGNLCPFCKAHHIVKHHGGWTVRQIDDGSGAIEWISPTGRVYVVKPERTVPVFRPTSDDTSTAPF